MSSISAIGRVPLIRPVAALAGWTFVMELWMYATRLPAISKYNLSQDQIKIKEQLNSEKVPPQIRAVADNYNHLHEQPTVFYAVALSLALLGDDHPYTVYAAWGYLGVRIVHSLVQASLNKVMVRFSLFATSGVVLAAMTGRLAQLVFSSSG